MGKYNDNSIVLSECKLIRKQNFYGFRADEKNKFIKISFNSMNGFYRARKILSEIDNDSSFLLGEKDAKYFELFENKIDVILKVIHCDKHINSVGWISFPLAKAVYKNNSRCQIEYTVSLEDIQSLDRTDIAPFRQMSYDIECYSHNPEMFPEAEN